MFRRFSPHYTTLLYLLDLGSVALALWLAPWLRMLPIGQSISERAASVPGAVYVYALVIFGALLPTVRLYDARWIYRAIDEAERVVFGAALSCVALAGTLYLTYRGVSRIGFIDFAAVAALLLLAHRAALRFLTRKNGGTAPRVLIVGTGPLGRQAAHALSRARVPIVGFIEDGEPERQRIDELPVLAGVRDIRAVVQQRAVTDVVFALPRQAQDRLTNVLVSLWMLPLRVFMVPDFFNLGFARAQVDYLGGLAMIGLREPIVDGFQRVAKRLVDLLLSTIILIFALPLMALIALAIRLDSPGPIVVRQQRVGENGRRFTMYKFRTMVADAETRRDTVVSFAPLGKIVHKRADDPRVTRVGRWLRRLSLDELLQLINVLRGEMSLVGPRPEMPWIVEQYDPWQYQRLAVPQGMTSWYVVNGRSEVPMHLNTQEDLRYVRDYSLLQDLKILWMSVGAVLRGRGAF